MIISHRGNIAGKNEQLENSPIYIDTSLTYNFDVEIDVWMKEKELYLGHDYPQYKIEYTWLLARKERLWIHCKNVDAIVFFNKNNNFNYFWHQNDDVTLTSKGYIWAYPGKQPIDNSIAVMPELYNDIISNCIGVCTDFPDFYKKNG
jgi:hypothetical protein